MAAKARKTPKRGYGPGIEITSVAVSGCQATISGTVNPANSYVHVAAVNSNLSSSEGDVQATGYTWSIVIQLEPVDPEASREHTITVSADDDVQQVTYFDEWEITASCFTSKAGRAGMKKKQAKKSRPKTSKKPGK